MSSLPSGQVTLMLTDIEGSTRLFRAHVAAYPGMLLRHQRVLAGIAAAHGGVLVDTEGDSALFAFDDAVGAAGAALAVGPALATADWADGPAPRVRVGLHVDELEPVDTPAGQRYVSLGVHRVARVAAAAHAEQVVVTDAVRRALIGRVDPARVVLVELGDYHLRGFDVAARLLELRAVGDDRTFPPVRAAVADDRTSDALSPLIGRASDVAALTELVGRERLVTVVGPGGCGKSRLAREVLLRLPVRPDGIRRVELAPIADRSSVAGAIAAAIGVRLDEERSVRDQLVDELGDLDLLVLLDNCEHVLDEVAILAQSIVRRCPQVSLLGTSRLPVDLPGEAVFELEPLGRDDAVALFRARAGTDPIGTDDREGLRQVSRICDALDRLPLAVELAAGCLVSMTVEELAAAIHDRPDGTMDDRFELLVTGSVAVPERHRALTDLLEHGHRLLDPDARVALRRLSVYAAPFDATMASWAVDARAAPVLRTLVAHRLLSIERAAGTTWYRMHANVRHFAQRQLRANDELGSTLGRVVRRALEAHPLDGPVDAAFLQRGEALRPNLRAITEQCLVVDPVAMCRMAVLLARLGWAAFDAHLDLEQLGRWAAAAPLDRPEGRALLAQLTFLLSLAGRTDEASAWLDRYHRSAVACGGDDPLRPGWVLRGYLDIALGRPGAAIAGLDAHDHVPLPDEGRMMVFWVRSTAHAMTGDRTRELADEEVALRLARRVGLANAVAVLEGNLVERHATVSGWRSQAGAVLDVIDRMIDLGRSVGLMLAETWRAGRVAYDTGRPQDAWTLLSSSVAVMDQPGVYVLDDGGDHAVFAELQARVASGELAPATPLEGWDLVGFARRVLADVVRDDTTVP